VTPPSRRGDPGFGGLPLPHRKSQQRRPHPAPPSNGSAAHHANPAAARSGLRPRALPLPGSGTSAVLVPRSVRVMPPQGGPRPDTGRTRRLPLHRPRMPSVSRPYGPKNEGTGENRSWTSSAAGRQPRPSPNTHHQHPSRQRNPSRSSPGACTRPGSAPPGPHPQGGVAIARSIDDARQRLADMLIFCDPAAAAVADITAFTPTRTVARYSGTVRRAVRRLQHRHHRPHRPRPPPHRPRHPDGWAAVRRDVPDPGQRRHHPPPHRPHRHDWQLAPRVHLYDPTTPGTSPPATSGARYRTNRPGPSPTFTAGTASPC